jgi:hypothetical protein
MLGAVFKVDGIFSVTGRGTLVSCHTLKGGDWPGLPFDVYWTDPAGAERSTPCKGVERFAALWASGKNFVRGRGGPSAIGLLVSPCEESDFEIGTIIYTYDNEHRTNKLSEPQELIA